MLDKSTSTLQWGHPTQDRAVRDRQIKECERKRVEMMDEARRLSSANIDCHFQWTCTNFARDLPWRRHWVDFDAERWDLAEFDSLDLETLKRAFNRGYITVRTREDNIRAEADRPSEKNRKRFDVLTRTMQLVDTILGEPLSWEGPETLNLLRSFSPPFEFKVEGLLLQWKFSEDYPRFPVVKGGFKKWSSDQARECDFAIISVYLTLRISDHAPARASAPAPILIMGTETPRNGEANHEPSAQASFLHQTFSPSRSSSRRRLSVVDLTDDASVSMTPDATPKPVTRGPCQALSTNEPKEGGSHETASTSLKPDLQEGTAPLKREHSEPPFSVSVSASPRPETNTRNSHAISAKQQSELSASSTIVGPSSVVDFQNILDAALKQHAEQLSAALDAQAATHKTSLQVLQEELGAAKSSLAQNITDMNDLKDQFQDMKDHINKRSSVLCSLEVQEEKLEQRIERLDKQFEQFKSYYSMDPAPALTVEHRASAPIECLLEAATHNETEAGTDTLNTPCLQISSQPPATCSTPFEHARRLQQHNSAEAPSLRETKIKAVDVSCESDNQPRNTQNKDEAVKILSTQRPSNGIPAAARAGSSPFPTPKRQLSADATRDNTSKRFRSNPESAINGSNGAINDLSSKPQRNPSTSNGQSYTSPYRGPLVLPAPSAEHAYIHSVMYSTPHAPMQAPYLSPYQVDENNTDQQLQVQTHGDRSKLNQDLPPPSAASHLQQPQQPVKRRRGRPRKYINFH